MMPGWTNGHIEKLNRKDRTTVRATRQKHIRQNALETAPKVQKLCTPCYFSMLVYRTGGNWDAENIQTKESLDSLVKSGVISGDTIEEVPKIVKEGRRAKTKADERTVIELFEV